VNNGIRVEGQDMSGASLRAKRRTQGNSLRTMSGDPSSELLSTTITSKPTSSRLGSRLCKHRRRSSIVFQLHMVTLSSKSATVSSSTHKGGAIDDSGEEWKSCPAQSGG